MGRFVRTIGIGSAMALASAASAQRERSTEMPDLAVISARVEANEVVAIVANLSGVPLTVRATATLFVRRPADRNDQPVPALGPRERAEIHFPLRVEPGTPFQVTADSREEITESNETNNSATVAGAGDSGRAGDPRASVTVDPTLARTAATYRAGTRSDGSVRPVGAARFPDGSTVPFVEDELMLTTRDEAQATALAARHGGTIVRRIDRPRDSAKGSTFVIRVNTSPPPAMPFAAHAGTFAFSGDAGRNLFAIIEAERAHGVAVVPNPVGQDQTLLTRSTVEFGGVNALALPYMLTGGLYDVDVANAWRALALAGKTAIKTVRIGIVDGGFDTQTANFTERDLDVETAIGTGGPNQGNCTGGSSCPWHGTNVAEAAASIPDDTRGTAGPGGPVARMILVEKGGGGSDNAISAMWAAVTAGADIINMSFEFRVPRDSGWFQGAWQNWLEDWEEDTVEIDGKYKRLIFAAAGNDGQDIDAKDDGDEVAWHAPCENRGVRCIGGWDANGQFPGRARAPNSNYTNSGTGETIDLWGPYCVMVGDDPQNNSAIVNTPVVRQICGTSGSSPMVAGVAALVWAANRSLTNTQVWDLMTKWATTPTPLPFERPMRRVHAYRAVREALMSTGQNVPPAITITSPAQNTALSQSFFAVTMSAESEDIEDQSCCQVTWTANGVNIGSGKSIMPSFVGKPLGAYTIIATARDSANATRSATLKATLSNTPPSLSLAPPAGPMVVGLPKVFTATVREETNTQNGGEDCARLKWTDSLGGLAPAVPLGCAPSLTFKTAGARTLTLVYTDAYGVAATVKQPVTVTAPATGVILATITPPKTTTGLASTDIVSLRFTAVGAVGKKLVPVWRLTDQAGTTKIINPINFLGALSFAIGDVFGHFKPPPAPRKFTLTLTVSNELGQISKPVSIDLFTSAEVIIH